MSLTKLFLDLESLQEIRLKRGLTQNKNLKSTVSSLICGSLGDLQLGRGAMEDDLLAPPLAVAGVQAEQELLLRPQAGQGEGGRGEGGQVAHQLTAFQLRHHGCEHLERSLGYIQDILERSSGYMIIGMVPRSENIRNGPNI